MMKFQTTLASGIAAVFLAPFALPQDDLLSLERALGETVRALEVLAGLEQRVETDPEAVELVLAATEEPTLAPEEGDQRLQDLRNQVSLLQMELDAIEVPELALVTERVVPVEPQGKPGPLRGTTPPRGAATAKVSAEARDPRARTESTAIEPADLARDLPPSPEGAEYSADPLRQAQACYQAGRYAEGLALLTRHEDPRALYWRARCLANLDRLDEAIAMLGRVVELGHDSYEGRRAANDLEFLQWKLEFLRNMPEGVRDGGQEG